MDHAAFGAAWLTLMASSWLLRPESGVPGLAAVPVVLAAAIILVIGDDHASPLARRIIGFAPVQWIGDISYSLYLWHWPLLILTPLALGVAKLGIAQRMVAARDFARTVGASLSDRSKTASVFPGLTKSRLRGLWAMRLLSPHIC